MAVKVMDLFDACAQNKLPMDHAYIVSSFINGNTGYAIFEVISYSGVKAIFPDGDGITFQSQGKKMHILIEPASYPSKGIEPYLRTNNEQIPLRFSELEILTSKNQIKIMLAKKPIESLSSFTVTKPSGFNFTFVFFNLDDIYETLTVFFEKSFNKETGIPQVDAKKAAKEAAEIIKKTMGFKSDYS